MVDVVYRFGGKFFGERSYQSLLTELENTSYTEIDLSSAIIPKKMYPILAELKKRYTLILPTSVREVVELEENSGYRQIQKVGFDYVHWLAENGDWCVLVRDKRMWLGKIESIRDPHITLLLLCSFATQPISLYHALKQNKPVWLKETFHWSDVVSRSVTLRPLTSSTECHIVSVLEKVLEGKWSP